MVTTILIMVEGAIPSKALDSQVLKMVLLTRTKHMNYYLNDRNNRATTTKEYLEQLL
jgi:hypothetical protein